jgi:hypothetical protein
MTSKTQPTLRLFLALAGALWLSACVNIHDSRPFLTGKEPPTVRLERSQPTDVPENALNVGQTLFVLLPADNAAGMLMPVPFVAEAVTSLVNHHSANVVETHYAGIDPFGIVKESFASSTLLASPQSDKVAQFTLRPFVFIQDCTDDQYRLALVADLAGKGWDGRYMVHLPGPYTTKDFDQGGAAYSQRIQTDLRAAADQLRQLIERAALGQLQGHTATAKVGSLHFVGSRSSGIVPPTMVVARKAQVIEERGDQVILRIPGDPKLPSASGGLFYGVHLLRRDQLHTFEKHADASSS